MSKASRLKGHCNRLFAISELLAPSGENLVVLFLVLGKGVLPSVCVVSFFPRFLRSRLDLFFSRFFCWSS